LFSNGFGPNGTKSSPAISSAVAASTPLAINSIFLISLGDVPGDIVLPPTSISSLFSTLPLLNLHFELLFYLI